MTAALFLASRPTGSPRKASLFRALVRRNPDGSFDVWQPSLTRASLAGFDGPDIGDDFGDEEFDDIEGDDIEGDDIEGDDIEGDDIEGDDEIGAIEDRLRRLGKRRNRLLAKQEKRNARRGGGNRRQRRSKMRENAVSFNGAVIGTAGTAVNTTFTPIATIYLDKIIATGDTNATITQIMAGQRTIYTGALNASILGTGSFNTLLWTNMYIKSGEPVTITYVSSSTSAGLSLTFMGKSKIASC